MIGLIYGNWKLQVHPNLNKKKSKNHSQRWNFPLFSLYLRRFQRLVGGYGLMWENDLR